LVKSDVSRRLPASCEGMGVRGGGKSYDMCGVTALVNILSLMVAASGWYYIFYSRAAHRLEKLENRRNNLNRIRCRRAAGLLLSLMGILIFVGSQRRFEPGAHPRTYIGIWIAVMFLLLIVVILAMIDLRLTLRIREEEQRRRRIDAGPVDR
jgi:hypothetical protein